MGRPLRPRPGIWSAPPKPLRPTQRDVPSVWLSFGWGPWVIGLFAACFYEAAAGWLPGCFALGMLMFVGPTVYRYIAEFFALRVTPADRALSDAPPGLVEFAVELTLYNANGPLAVDRGFVWIEDGILTFNGAACSFVLAPEDFYRRGLGAYKPPQGIPIDALRLRIPETTAHIRFVPLHASRGIAFPYRLGCFQASVNQTNRPRQWPPLHPYGEPSPEPMPTGSPEALGAQATRTGSSIGIVRTKRTETMGHDSKPLNAKRL